MGTRRQVLPGPKVESPLVSTVFIITVEKAKRCLVWGIACSEPLSFVLHVIMYVKKIL